MAKRYTTNPTIAADPFAPQNDNETFQVEADLVSAILPVTITSSQAPARPDTNAAPTSDSVQKDKDTSG
ncbi:hypothetical protein BGX27_001002 [Mortierella sp. AM989]|nr:hypothetical protein BGX27_001002 [Mortierella sp. AM989]